MDEYAPPEARVLILPVGSRPVKLASGPPCPGFEMPSGPREVGARGASPAARRPRRPPTRQHHSIYIGVAGSGPVPPDSGSGRLRTTQIGCSRRGRTPAGTVADGVSLRADGWVGQRSAPLTHGWPRRPTHPKGNLARFEGARGQAGGAPTATHCKDGTESSEREEEVSSSRKGIEVWRKGWITPQSVETALQAGRTATPGRSPRPRSRSTSSNAGPRRPAHHRRMPG